MIAAAPVPPLGGPTLLLFFLQIGLLLTMALVLGRLAEALALPRLVGELFTGIVLGPSILGMLAPVQSIFPQDPQQVHLLDAVGQVGVVLLVGLTGLRMDLGLLRRKASTAVRVSLPGLVIPLGLGVGAGFLLPASLLTRGGDRTVFAIFLGIALCVSAIPVIAKILLDMRMLHRNIGQLILISATVDDLLGWLGLSVLTALVTTGLTAAIVAKSIGLLLAFVCGAVLIGRPLITVVLRAVTNSREPAARDTGTRDTGTRDTGTRDTGTIVAVVVTMIIGLSATAGALGLEPVFGALVAGMLIKSCVPPQARARLATLWPFVMSVLAPVYFATVGLRMDLTALAHMTVLIAAMVLLFLAVLGKFAGACLGSWMSGLNRWETLAVVAGMNVRGVVGVIVASVGLRLGVLTTSMYTVIVLIAVATSVMGPPILRVAVRRIDLTAEERVRLAADEAPAKQPAHFLEEVRHG